RKGGGMYPDAVRRVPLGVGVNMPGAAFVPSGRRLWRVVEGAAAAEGESQARIARPRTCVNNCTRAGARRAGVLVEGQAARLALGMDAARFWSVQWGETGAACGA
ncbi:MAG: hypothetical protein N2483_10240, partial [Burkholderiaceae bacterium]|nr:hypothetical protein [Burkholderiaceae bacterium]